MWFAQIARNAHKICYWFQFQWLFPLFQFFIFYKFRMVLAHRRYFLMSQTTILCDIHFNQSFSFFSFVILPYLHFSKSLMKYKWFDTHQNEMKFEETEKNDIFPLLFSRFSIHRSRWQQLLLMIYSFLQSHLFCWRIGRLPIQYKIDHFNSKIVAFVFFITKFSFSFQNKWTHNVPMFGCWILFAKNEAKRSESRRKVVPFQFAWMHHSFRYIQMVFLLNWKDFIFSNAACQPNDSCPCWKDLSKVISFCSK